MPTDPLSPFHPLIRDWFLRQVGAPTELQARAWPRIAAGEHLLITAPTGSGKTLTAFLWALDRFASGAWRSGATRVLYVSPLKALNNDIQRNLLGPLSALRAGFEAAGRPFPSIEVATRSGDTPPEERRRMLRHPPEILITTPESLNLILSSAAGGVLLATLETVILDEIHAVVGNKRGTHLITAVERIVRLSGEFQRLALSATVRPPRKVAEFVGGYRLDGGGYTARSVGLVESAASKDYQVEIRALPEAGDEDDRRSVWSSLADDIKSSALTRNRSTLIFVRSRNLCEKMTRLINEGAAEPIAYAHHGALSREIRTEVERRLKAGELDAIVATSSLELGIDVGALDEVLLIQSPETVSSAVQRVGRAGHGVGELSRALLYPTHGQDALEAALLARCIVEQDIEEVSPVRAPLDVLAQVLVSMTLVEEWSIDALYDQVRTSQPYRELGRGEFDLVLKMLAGRYAESRIRELSPRVSIDGIDRSVVARKGARLALYSSGGTIPNRGYFKLRHRETGALIGELDEEYVWEASIGQSMTLGTQSWRIEQITHSDVFVLPGRSGARDVPFWKAEGRNRGAHFSERIAELLESVGGCEDETEMSASLRRSAALDEASAQRLAEHLLRQKRHTECTLPHRHHLLVERLAAAPGGEAGGSQLVVHTLWGGRVNRPYAMALEAAWEERFGAPLETFAGDDCISLMLPHEIDAAELLALVTTSNLNELLRRRLESSGFFGARFRECAGRALLLSRRRMNERLPLWVSRLRSQKLLASVRRYQDFPIVLEAWRTCLQDELDVASLSRKLAELESGSVDWSETRTATASPFARTVAWRQVSEYMYRDDTPAASRGPSVSDDLLREVVFDSGLRPRVSRELVEDFERRRRRLKPGYAPDTARDLLDWGKERQAIGEDEWRELLRAHARESGCENPAAEIGDKLVRVTPRVSGGTLIVARENVARLVAALWPGEQATLRAGLEGDATFEIDPSAGASVTADDEDVGEELRAIVGEWLRFRGPVEALQIAAWLGIDEPRLRAALADLVETGELIAGALVEGEDEERVCDSQNFETLLRMARARALPSMEPLDLELLPVFLARHQGVDRPGSGVETLFERIEQLSGYSAPAGEWEADLLPARVQDYSPAILDQLLQEGDLRWIGVGDRRIAFWLGSEFDLRAVSPASDEKKGDPLPSEGGRFDFEHLLRSSGASVAELSERLWTAVWRGALTNDTFVALRRAIDSSFRTPEVGRAAPGARIRRRGARRSFAQWKSAVPFAGSWYRLPALEDALDPIEAEERNRDRVRLLLDRYGVLFRELLERESSPFRWAPLFRTLRLMELSGEIVSGCFFHGIGGLQFASERALRGLRRGIDDRCIFWIAATDPASLCGIGLEGLRGKLPKRLSGTHLVYRGTELVMVSRARGRELEIGPAPDAPELTHCWDPLHHLLRRPVRPLRAITVESINGEPALRSPYLDALRVHFEVETDHKNVTLRKGSR